MLPFRDIFVIQIIGLLAGRRFSGDCNLRLSDKSQGQLIFVQGRLTAVRHGNRMDTGVLDPLLWVSEGELELVGRAYPVKEWNAMEPIDQAILRSSPPMPESCPLMNHLHLSRGKLSPEDGSELKMAALAIYSNVPASGALAIQAQGDMAKGEYWKGLFHLFASGQMMGDYAPLLNPLLTAIQANVVANLQTLLGIRTAEEYQGRLAAQLTAHGSYGVGQKGYDPFYDSIRANINVVLRSYGQKGYDPLYGSAPYATWMALIRDTIPQVASSALGSACYKQAMVKLDREDAALLQLLSVKPGKFLP